MSRITLAIVAFVALRTGGQADAVGAVERNAAVRIRTELQVWYVNRTQKQSCQRVPHVLGNSSPRALTVPSRTDLRATHDRASMEEATKRRMAECGGVGRSLQVRFVSARDSHAHRDARASMSGVPGGSLLASPTLCLGVVGVALCGNIFPHAQVSPACTPRLSPGRSRLRWRERHKE